MRVLVTGASGQLGAYLLEAFREQGDVDLVGWSGRQREHREGITLEPVDLADAERLSRALESCRPDAVIHVAAISSADTVRLDPARAEAVNVGATSQIAKWCADHDRRFVFTSTDLVFDGRGSWYREEDPAQPLQAYGRTKREAEAAALSSDPGALVARLSLLYGPSRCGRESFFDREMAALRAGEARKYFVDEFRTPLDYRTAARILARVVRLDVRGLLHVAGPERLSRYELMARAGAVLGIDPGLIQGNHQADAALAEPRPADVSLNTERLARLLPDFPRQGVEVALGDLV